MNKFGIFGAAFMLSGLLASAAFANNLTSLGVDANGNTAWRFTSTAQTPQLVKLERAGSGGASTTYLVNPGQSVAINGPAGTYIATFEDGKRVTKASGPQPYNPGPTNGQDGQDGAPGRDGVDGQDGAPGRDGRDADTAAIEREMRKIRGQQAADRATGNLQTRTAAQGQWTGALGISGNEYGADGIAGGVRYGISDRADLYAIVGVSDSGEMSWGVGATFILGGNPAR